MLGTTALSILSGHQRYARINELLGDGIRLTLLGMNKVVSFAGAFYHITSRGDLREAVFEDDEDREAFPGQGRFKGILVDKDSYPL